MEPGMEQERRRLQGLYAGLSDGQLLNLAESKDGLTEIAQQAVDAEIATRGLEVSAEEAPEAKARELDLPAAEDDSLLVELRTFEIAADAETALRELDNHGIPVRLEPALRRLTEGGPKIRTNWLSIFVERTRQGEAVEVLRKRMGLFPVLASEEMDDPDDVHDGEEEALFAIGEFDNDADAEVARKALTDAGVWFKAEKVSEPAIYEQKAFEGTIFETRLEDLERALEVVEAAFSES